MHPNEHYSPAEFTNSHDHSYEQLPRGEPIDPALERCVRPLSEQQWTAFQTHEKTCRDRLNTNRLRQKIYISSGAPEGWITLCTLPDGCFLQKQSFYTAKPRRRTVQIATCEVRGESLEEVPTNTTLPWGPNTSHNKLTGSATSCASCVLPLCHRWEQRRCYLYP